LGGGGGWFLFFFVAGTPVTNLEKKLKFVIQIKLFFFRVAH